MHDPAPAFRALHRKGDPFILANAWDVGSARMLAGLGMKALATTSAGHAFTLGRPDGGTITRDEALAHAADLVTATPLPVSGDLEDGFGPAPEDVAETIRLAAEAGLAGCGIEDTALPDQSAYDRDLAIERIRAGVAAAKGLSRDFVLTARADGVLTGHYDMQEATARCIAFAKAGADCIYVPLVPDLDALKALCAAVDCPVNVLAVGRMQKHNQAEFAAAGTARISLGSVLARATHKVIADGTAAMLAGDFSAMKMMSGDAVDALLEAGKRTD